MAPAIVSVVMQKTDNEVEVRHQGHSRSWHGQEACPADVRGSARSGDDNGHYVRSNILHG